MIVGGKDRFMTTDGAKIHLVSLGQKDDSEVDVIEAALAFAMMADDIVDVVKYRDFIATMMKDLQKTYDDMAAKKNGDSVHVQADALKAVMADKYAFIGDDIHYDDLKNINLCHVIDRHMGLPITLCILAVGICRGCGWTAEGINFPGHFIMRLEKDGDRLMIDPFQGCKVLEAKDMRLILKRIMGEYAELSATYYDPCTNREMLLRLQNNMKYRLIDGEDYQGALDVVDKMVWIAPQDHRLCLDKAVLFARLDQPKAAIENLVTYIDLVQDPYDKAEAEQFLIQLQKQLN
jgi:regulator of sirC expression with transglutaminase-like and TPR domain